MRWKSLYTSRLKSVDEALGVVKSGDWVVPSHAAGESRVLMNALVRRAQELRDVTIWQGVTLSKGEYAQPDCAGHFRLRSHFLCGYTRDCIAGERGDYTPMPFSSIPDALERGVVKNDVWLGMVSPPDENGYCNFGVSCDIARVSVRSAGYSIAHVNPNMPRTCGDTLIHVSEIDCFVEEDDALYSLDPADASGADTQKIGRNIAELIEDGDTIQMGIGGVPNAILEFLKDKKNLGVHTEVFSDNLIPLIESGVINGERKSVNPRKIVATFIQGTADLYRYVNNNNMILMMPVHYTNSVGVIASHDNMVAINAALEVDLMGQVVADSLGNRQFSGVGGQLDFMRGAAGSKGGKAIIALASTARNGSVSRISAYLKPGTAVTTTRNDVRFVVTEHGVANLQGKSLTERARALINIAAPQFREQLEREFHEVRKTL